MCYAELQEPDGYERYMRVARHVGDSKDPSKNMNDLHTREL